jgi:hypothetical protein
MGRPSVLRPEQWEEVKEARLRGETFTSLSKRFRVGKSTLVEGISDRVSEIKKVAETLRSAMELVDTLPCSDRGSAINLTNELREISSNLAVAAKYGSVTAQRLAMIAAHKANSLPMNATMRECEEELKTVIALTRTANDASMIGMGLINTNKKMLESQYDDMPIEEVQRRIAQLEARR